MGTGDLWAECELEGAEDGGRERMRHKTGQRRGDGAKSQGPSRYGGARTEGGGQCRAWPSAGGQCGQLADTVGTATAPAGRLQGRLEVHCPLLTRLTLLSTRGTCSSTSASTAPAPAHPPWRVWTSGRSTTSSQRRRAVCGSCMIAGPPMPFSWSSSG